MNPGGYIGIFIGILAGILTARIVFTLAWEPPDGFKSLTGLFAQIAAVPGFVFGGGWISSRLLEKRWDQLFDSYVQCLAITSLLIIFPSVILWMWREFTRNRAAVDRPNPPKPAPHEVGST